MAQYNYDQLLQSNQHGHHGFPTSGSLSVVNPFDFRGGDNESKAALVSPDGSFRGVDFPREDPDRTIWREGVEQYIGKDSVWCKRFLSNLYQFCCVCHS